MAKTQVNCAGSQRLVGPRAALPPQAQRLPFEQVRAVLQRRQHARLRRHGRVAGEQPRLQLVDVVARLEAVAQHQRAARRGRAGS